MGLMDINLGGIFKTVGDTVDDLHTSKEELRQLDIEEKKIDAGLMKGQMAVNAVEAEHKSIFVAGWRPFIGWVGGFSLAYAGLVYPLLSWLWGLLQAFELIPSTVKMPPMIESGLLGTIVTGMLGIGGMRSFDKHKGTDTKRMK